MKHLDFPTGRFYNEDCFDAMREIPDGCVDMILCDLPYGTTACKWDAIIPFNSLWAEYWRICKGAVVLTASQPFTSALVMSQVDYFKHSWIWNKAKAANFVQVKNHPLKIHEDVLVFAKNNTYKAIMEKGVFRKKGGYKTSNKEAAVSAGAPEKFDDLYYPKSIFEFSLASNKETGHPTQKPVALFEYLIRTYTNEEMLVLDNTAGSGTTAIAAINTNRRWICIERDEEYALKAVERIKNHKPPETLNPDDRLPPPPISA